MPVLLASDLWSTLANPSQGLVVLSLIGAILIFLVVCVVGSYFLNYRKTEHEVSLKREMLDRGMSAEDIERVLAARLGEPPDAPEAE